jgi:hypothetical protein
MIFRSGFVVATAALVCVLLISLPMPVHAATPPASQFDQPAADLALQIAALTGPGPAKLVIHNNSTLPSGEILVIRQLLERDLRSFGVTTGSSDSATIIRVTLSQNLRGGLWVAEVDEGTEIRVAMLPVNLQTPTSTTPGPTLTLRRTLLLTAAEPDAEPILDAALIAGRLIVLEPDRLVVYNKNSAAVPATTADWSESQTLPIAHARSFPRDLRGRIFPAPEQGSAHLFDAYLPGVLCTGSNDGAQLAISCAESDDPWPITAAQHAFYSAMRDYFTGILAPGFSFELQPFYNAADLPRPTGAAILLNQLNGNVLLIENNAAKLVSGANDWGSDFAVIRSGCGSGAQVLVSGSGAAAAGDSLRAFEISGREAIAVSPPLPIDGAITAISPAPDSTTANVIVRRDAPTRWEVWNVAPLCN